MKTHMKSCSPRHLSVLIYGRNWQIFHWSFRRSLCSKLLLELWLIRCVYDYWLIKLLLFNDVFLFVRCSHRNPQTRWAATSTRAKIYDFSWLTSMELWLGTCYDKHAGMYEVYANSCSKNIITSYNYKLDV